MERFTREGQAYKDAFPLYYFLRMKAAVQQNLRPVRELLEEEHSPKGNYVLQRIIPDFQLLRSIFSILKTNS